MFTRGKKYPSKLWRSIIHRVLNKSPPIDNCKHSTSQSFVEPLLPRSSGVGTSGGVCDHTSRNHVALITHQDGLRKGLPKGVHGRASARRRYVDWVL